MSIENRQPQNHPENPDPLLGPLSETLIDKWAEPIELRDGTKINGADMLIKAINDNAPQPLDVPDSSSHIVNAAEHAHRQDLDEERRAEPN